MTLELTRMEAENLENRPAQPASQSVGDKVVQAMASPRSGHLNTWATAMYFRVGGGRGLPSWEDCHGTTERFGVVIADPPILAQKELDKMRGLLTYDYNQSERMFDATPKKYGPAAAKVRVDLSVLASVVHVEVALRKIQAPRVLRAYLLWLYPQWGKYVPLRPDHYRDDPARSFLDTPAAMAFLLGNQRGAYIDRHARGLVANLVNCLHKEMGP